MYKTHNVRMRMFFTVMIIVATMVLLNGNAVLAESVNFNGSLEVNVSCQNINDDYVFGAATGSGLGDAISFRGDFGLNPSDQVGVKFRISYLNNTLLNSPSDGTFILSRGYIDLTPNNLFSFRFGKQRLAWGTGYAWNPTNVLDQKRNVFTPGDDPEGIMAFRTDLNLGLAFGQLFLVPGNEWDKSGQAVRLKVSPFGLDLGLGWVKPGTDPAGFIGDFAYSIAGIGLHGEVLYQKEGNRRTDKTNVLNYLVGADYNLPGGIYLALEYYHNDEAFEDINDLKYYLMTHFATNPLDPNTLDLIESRNFVMDQTNNGGITRDHLFLRSSKSIGEIGNAELLLIYNPSDKSLVAQPKLSYILGQNTEIFVKGLLLTGQGDVEANLSPVKNQFNFGVKVSF